MGYREWEQMTFESLEIYGVSYHPRHPHYAFMGQPNLPYLWLPLLHATRDHVLLVRHVGVRIPGALLNFFFEALHTLQSVRACSFVLMSSSSA